MHFVNVQWMCMAVDKLITIEVAYALPHEQCILTLQIKEGSTIEFAINQSGILKQFPEIDLTKQKVGVFSKSRKLTDTVFANDRIEIYRPLLIDPKEARRRRAK
jgi:putative ubiquitin-RnfH superfamily antitoxin RatB of RatAB toxin-antitoxin module